MHLVLLLLVQVHAEWVEIYQQHYKKPLRPLSTHTALDKPGFERTTKGNRVYINNSLPEYNWNQAVHEISNVDIRRNQHETSSVSVIYKHEYSEPKPINIKDEDVETKEKGIMLPYKPVTGQRDKDADFIYHEVPKKSTAVMLQRIKPTETPIKPIKYDDFEIKHLEVYNLSDIEFDTEEDTTTTINNKDLYAPLTTSPATKFKTSSKHSLTTKIPNQELSKLNEQEFYVDDWPINEDRYEYVVQIVPSNSNKRRVDIVRSPVKPNVLKATNYNIFASHIPTSTSTSKSKHNLEINDFVRDTTIVPKVQLNPKPQEIRQKANVTSTTIQPEPEIDTVISEVDNKEQTKLIHLSTNIYSKIGLKDDKSKIRGHSSIPKTDPDEVMLHEILKNEDISPEITFRKLSQSNTGIVKRVYPTKIIKVDKNGHETGGSNILLRPTKATFTNGELTTVEHNKENQDKNFYRIPYQANIKQVSVVTPKHFNKTIEIENGSIRPVGTQTTHDTEERTVSIADDDNYKNHFKESFKSMPKVTTMKTPILTTTETKYSKNSFDRNIEKIDPGSYESYVTSHDKIPEFITKEKHFIRQQESDNSKVKVNKNEHIDVQQFDVNTNFNQLYTDDTETTIQKVSDENVTENPIKDKNEHKQDDFDTSTKDRTHETFEETSSSENKPSTMETLMKILKIVTDTIKRNTRRNFNSKVQYLEDLRDTISRSIEDRIEATFPDDNTAKPSLSRMSRSTQAQPRGHVEFPSSESALMTISFLTFAVYLIKLVLQIIQAYKNKTMMMMPTVVAAIGRAYERSKN